MGRCLGRGGEKRGDEEGERWRDVWGGEESFAEGYDMDDEYGVDDTALQVDLTGHFKIPLPS